MAKHDKATATAPAPLLNKPLKDLTLVALLEVEAYMGNARAICRQHQLHASAQLLKDLLDSVKNEIASRQKAQAPNPLPSPRHHLCNTECMGMKLGSLCICEGQGHVTHP